MVYLPGVMLRITYSPALLETEVCSTDVSTLCSTMAAPEITDPLGSRITPFTEAVETWALAEPARSKSVRLRKPAKRRPGIKLIICRAKPSVRSCMEDLSQKSFCAWLSDC